MCFLANAGKHGKSLWCGETVKLQCFTVVHLQVKIHKYYTEYMHTDVI